MRAIIQTILYGTIQYRIHEHTDEHIHAGLRHWDSAGRPRRTCGSLITSSTVNGSRLPQVKQHSANRHINTHAHAHTHTHTHTHTHSTLRMQLWVQQVAQCRIRITRVELLILTHMLLSLSNYTVLIRQRYTSTQKYTQTRTSRHREHHTGSEQYSAACFSKCKCRETSNTKGGHVVPDNPGCVTAMF